MSEQQNLDVVRSVYAAFGRGDLDEARHWFNRLEQVEPNSQRTRALKAELARKLEAAKQ